MRLPTRCMTCAAWCGQAVCPACLARFAPAPAAQPRCRSCAARVPSGVVVCAECVRTPVPQVGTVAAVDYRPPWDQLVQAMKFGNRPDGAAAFAQALADAIRQHPQASAAPVALVVPIPLSPARLRLRGYNQAWEIARRLGRLLRLPTHPAVLQRWVELTGQAESDRSGRLSRLQGVFGVPSRQRHRVVGRVVAVVDDVYTTGATVAEAVRALRAAGADAVWVWAGARTPPPQDGAS